MNLGRTIQLLRKRQGLTQEALAEKAGLSRPSLSQIENNAVRPEQDTLKRLSEALGVPESFVYLYSFEREDVPEGRRDKYDVLFPIIENLIEQLVETGPDPDDGRPKEK